MPAFAQQVTYTIKVWRPILCTKQNEGILQVWDNQESGIYLLFYSAMATRQPLGAKKIHPGACSSCVLCGKPQNRYTHTINWSQQQRDWLQQHLAIPVDESACICKSCGDNVKKGISDSHYKPQWVKLTSKPTTTCDVIGCHSQPSFHPMAPCQVGKTAITSHFLLLQSKRTWHCNLQERW